MPSGVWAEKPGEVEAAQIGEERETRQDAERERVGEQHDRERRVRYRHDDIGGGRRRCRYFPVPHGAQYRHVAVAGARQDDGVHAHTDVRAENGRPRDALVG